MGYWEPTCDFRLSSSLAEHPTISSASLLKIDTYASPLASETLATKIYLKQMGQIDNFENGLHCRKVTPSESAKSHSQL